MKFQIKFGYIADENTTLKYDSDCKKFMDLVKTTGALISIDYNNINTTEEILSYLKDCITRLLFEFSKKYLAENAIKLSIQSFTIEIWQLFGINELVTAIIINDYKPNDSIKIYSGAIINIKNQ